MDTLTRLEHVRRQLEDMRLDMDVLSDELSSDTSGLMEEIRAAGARLDEQARTMIDNYGRE